MTSIVGVRELRQNLSKYLDRVKAGETLTVTERGKEVARLVRSGSDVDPVYVELAEEYGASIPNGDLVQTIKELDVQSSPDGTTDAFLEDSRRDRV